MATKKDEWWRTLIPDTCHQSSPDPVQIVSRYRAACLLMPCGVSPVIVQWVARSRARDHGGEPTSTATPAQKSSPVTVQSKPAETLSLDPLFLLR